MSNGKSTKERLAVIENELLHIKETLKQIAENHLPHIYDEISKFSTFCVEAKDDLEDIQINKKRLKEIADNIEILKNNSKSKLTGRDKAIIVGAFLSAFIPGVVAVAIEVIRAW